MIELRGVSKRYNKKNNKMALDSINLKIQRGEYLAIVGRSGSGKSTLLNIIGLLDEPTKGEYYFDNHDTSSQLVDKTKLRLEKFGFVFQSFNLMVKATVMRNVYVPMLYNKVSKTKRFSRAKKLLCDVELDDYGNRFPNQLSGGEKQRVAIARALANDPLVILADEPTGALDCETQTQVLNIFEQLHSKGRTIIIVTHDEDVAKKAKRIVTLSDGRIISDEVNLNVS